MSILDDVMGEYGFAVPKAAYDKLQEHIAARQPVGQEPDDYVEFLDRQNDSLRRAIHAIMAKLAFLLDEDQFADMDAIALAAGVSPPAQAVDLGQPLPLIARALAEWHEDDGNVLWWAWCGREWAGEPAWAGTPNDSDWPGYHTHWTPHPNQPALIDRKAVGND